MRLALPTRVRSRLRPTRRKAATMGSALRSFARQGHLVGRVIGRPRRTSLNHLVGAGQQSRRHLDAERLSSPEVDGKLEFGRLLNRQVSRLGAFQDAIDIERRLAKLTGRIDAV